MRAPTGILAAALTACCAVAAAAAGEKPPNIVLVFVDDWGWGDMGANWAGTTDTPNLDGIARDGLRLLDFHAGASVCTPSRAALMTGRLAPRTGVWTNFGPASLHGLALEEHIVPQYLDAAGYESVMIGKWHLGTHETYHPTYRGFSKYLGLPYSNDMGCTNSEDWDLPPITPCPYDPQVHIDESFHTRVPPTLESLYNDMRTKQAAVSSASSAAAPFPGSYMASSSPAVPLYNATTNCTIPPLRPTQNCSGTIVEQPVDLVSLNSRYADFAEQVVRDGAASGTPFFLYAALAHMHVPLAHLPAFTNSSTAKTVFGDTLRELDAFFGRLRAVLEDTGLDKETLLFITGDNGPWEEKCEFAGSPGPYTGSWQAEHAGGGSTGKFTTWEGGHREAAVAFWPSVIPPNTTSSTLSSTTDLLPTFLDLAGVTPPTDRVLDGQSLVPTLLHPDTQQTPNRALFHPDILGNPSAWRMGDLKFFRSTYSFPGCGGTTGLPMDHDPPLVFNVTADPSESTPLTVPNATIAAADLLRSNFLLNVSETFRTQANYSDGTRADWPCCNLNHVVCRCTD